MKTIFLNRIVCVLCAFAILLSICGCSNNTNVAIKPYDASSEINTIQSGVIAQNSNYLLEWDADKYCVSLRSKTSDLVYSTIPYDYYLQLADTNIENAIGLLVSPLKVSYYQEGVNTIQKVEGSSLFSNGRIASERVENGIKVTYYFDTLEFSIPIYYVLEEQSIKIYIVPSEIEEHIYKIHTISIAPMFCSVANSAENYVVIPSGSGAIMYTDERNTSSRTYTTSLYGNDLSCQVYEKFDNTQNALIPAFGAFSDQKGMVGIITDGAESAEISTECGNANLKVSNVYTTFVVRNYNISQVEYTGEQKVKEFWAFADKITSASKYAVAYYPIVGDKANYSGMAELVRNYFIDKYDMSENAQNSELSVDILGGVETKNFVFGVPYYSVSSTTTFNQAEDILKDISNYSNSIDVRLLGFGESGMSPGKVAGGFDFASVYGKKKDFISLQNLCSNNEFNLFVDYDIVGFNKSGNGFTVSNDCIRTVNGYKANQNIFSISLRNIDEEQKEYYILNRSSISKASEKLLSIANDKDIGNISLSTLGNIRFSDYTDYKYYNCNNMEQNVRAIIENYKASNKKVMVDAANSYAAAVADKIVNAPTLSSQNDAFDIDIPLYQMVFKGYVPLSNTPINYASNSDIQFLKCVESGTGLSFALTGGYDSKIADTAYSSYFLTTVYNDNKDLIADYIKRYHEIFSMISDSQIISNTVIDKELRCTTFNNGVVVYINYGDSERTIADITVPAKDFNWIESR